MTPLNYVFLFQLLTHSLTLVEGSEYGEIEISSNTPPQLFCPINDRRNCTVKLFAQIRASKEKKCHDKRLIPQAVIMWHGDNTETPFCGVSVSKASWDRVHRIHLKGVVDSLKDRDQKLTVQVWAELITSTQETRIDLGHVQVTHLMY